MSNLPFDFSKQTKKETQIFSSVSTAHIVWLRQRNQIEGHGEELYRQMQSQGVTLTIVDAFDVTADELLRADLVLLDAFDSLEGSIETVVARVRFESRVPLVMLTNGYSSEQLVTALTAGADGIWSRIRHQICELPQEEVGIRYADKHASYSGYTCFTGTCQHTPEDIKDVAYKVFLGQQQYLGCTDAGHGWQHWWAFLPDAPSLGALPTDVDGKKMLGRLQREFAGWSPEIHDLFNATKPEVVRQRDLFDRKPMWNGWLDKNGANVVLLGGTSHTVPATCDVA